MKLIKLNNRHHIQKLKKHMAPEGHKRVIIKKYTLENEDSVDLKNYCFPLNQALCFM